MPRPPVHRRAAERQIAPVPTSGANVHTTEHFRVLWGDDYPKSDPGWADNDGSGTPDWVEVISEALEEAYAGFAAMGFAAPYGSEKYYLDAYVADTGVIIEGDLVDSGVDENYYAYTMIDVDYKVAYFIFNDAFPPSANDALEILKVTAAHELFHAVQRAYYPWDDEVAISNERWLREGWWTEASATWMEDVIYPEINDYVEYVNNFMANPEESLTSMNGLREYGASAFVGYLWDNYGDAPLVQNSMLRILDLGVEGAVESVLSENGDPMFHEVVAFFWTFAAAPDGVWADGDLFMPALPARSASALPFEFSSNGLSAPQRYGANIIKIPNPAGGVSFELSEICTETSKETCPEASWFLGFLSQTADALPEIKTLEGDGTPAIYEKEVSEWAFAAIVNGAASEGARPYSVRIVKPDDPGASQEPKVQDKPTPGATETDEAKSWTHEGCFIGSLMNPLF